MKNGTSANGHIKLAPTPTSPRCPTCGQPVTKERLDEILCVSEARNTEIAKERAALEDRESELDEVVQEAIESERARWMVVASQLTARVGTLRTAHDKAIEQLAATHQKRLDAEVRRRTATQEKLERDREAFRRVVEREKQARKHEVTRYLERRNRERTTMEARAQAQAKRTVKEAAKSLREEQRVADERQKRLIASLKKEIQTVEGRRRREQDSMRRTIAALQRKAEGRDRAHFGPDGEEALVALLRDEFPGDRIEHHGKGGDVVQFVVDKGRDVGAIVYEVKNTRGWDAAFVRQTARAAEQRGASIGILCSRVLPAKQSIMTVKDGVIVVVPEIVAQVAGVVRDGLVSLARMSAGASDKQAKESALVDFLRGREFTTAMKCVAHKIVEVQRSLAREKSAHGATWARREQGYLSILRATSGIDARITELLVGVGA